MLADRFWDVGLWGWQIGRLGHDAGIPLNVE
jgi:hypothetical protein